MIFFRDLVGYLEVRERRGPEGHTPHATHHTCPINVIRIPYQHHSSSRAESGEPEMMSGGVGPQTGASDSCYLLYYCSTGSAVDRYCD